MHSQSHIHAQFLYHLIRSLPVLILLISNTPRIFAAQLAWTNTIGGNWSTASNWSPNQVPTGADTAVITNAGIYTVTNSTTVTVAAITLGLDTGTNAPVTFAQLRHTAGTLTVTNLTIATNASVTMSSPLTVVNSLDCAGQMNQTISTLWLQNTGAINIYNLSGGDQRGGTLTVTNFNWVSGNLYADAPGNKTIIPPGGVLNFPGAATRYLTYNSPATAGRGLDNYGTWNWTGDSVLYGLQTGCVVNNYGTVIATNTTPSYFSYYPGYSYPVWNNYGTFTKSGTGIFYFQACYLNNAGTVNHQSGTFSIYNSATFTNSTGLLSVGAGAVFQTELSSTATFGAASQIIAPTVNSLRFAGTSVSLETTNIVSPSIWLQAGTLYQRTNIAVSTINQSSGAFQLEVPCFLNQLNQTNGDVQGRSLTVTNWNWVAGNHYRGNTSSNTVDDRTIIPAGGVMNLLGTATRYLSYLVAPAPGRTLDNFGTVNWSGNAIFGGYGTFNNYGSVNVTASGTAQYYSPDKTAIWNNYGSFSRSAGTLFYFQNIFLNNTGNMDFQQGTLSIYASTFNNNGPLNIANATLQAYASTCTNNSGITLDAASFFTVDSSGTFTFETNSLLVVPAYNHFVLNAGNVYLRTTNISTPSVWVAGAGLYFQTNNVCPTVNMSAGGIQLDVPIRLAQLNQTNGNVQGRTLTVTNWNWFAGVHYRGNTSSNTVDDRTIIPAGGVMNFLGTDPGRGLSYLVNPGPGRTLDNFGTINWSGAAVLSSYGSMNNYGAVNVSAVGVPQYYSPAPSSVPSTWNNYGTFTRSAGTLFYFQGGYVNNAGLMDVQQGTLDIYSATLTNSTGVINLGASGILQSEVNGVIVLGAASQLTAATANSVRLAGASAAIETTNIVSPTIWLQAGTLYQRTNIAVATINESGGAFQLDVPAALNQLNQTNGDVQGRSLIVTNWNWVAGNHYRGNTSSNTVDDRTIIPAGGVMNLLGATTRYLSYLVNPAPGRTLDNFGTINWSGDAVFGGYGTVNNYGAVNVSATGTAQYYSPNSTAIWNNYGTFTRSTGSLFYFQTVFLNNAGTMNFQSGIASLYTSTFTNSTGLVNISGSGILQSEANSTVVLGAASQAISPIANTIRLGGASATIETTNILSPSIWLQAGTLYQRTNIVVATINESGGALQLDVPTSLSQLNQTNGDVQGRSLTITNWNWFAGNHYRGTAAANTNDDRTIIPAGGTMNLFGATTRYLSYQNFAAPGRTLDNFGTVNWSGDAVFGGYGTFNNYGSVNVSATGTAQYYSPNNTAIWNNYGTFTRSAGTLLYFQSVFLNNAGTMDLQSGTVSIYNSANFTNSTGLLNVGPSTIFQTDLNSLATFGSSSRVVAATANSIRFNGASATIETTNIVSPTIWLQAGTLYQRTNIVVATINESGGALQLDVPTSLSQLNQTNGDIQGRSLTITNWNWFAGYHYRGTAAANTNDDRTIIPPGGTMNLFGATTRYLSYQNFAAPGRTLDNFGSINWSGDAVFGGYGTVNNYGSVNIANSGTAQYYSPNSTAIWNNYGTFTRSAGTLLYFQSVFLNNTGTMNLQSGTVSIYNSANFTNQSGGNVLVQPGAVLANDLNSTSSYEAGSSLGCANANAFQINSGTVTLRTTSISAPSLWINGGTLNQNTNNVVPIINENGGVWKLNVPVSISAYNLTSGELRGANLAVDTFNWLGGNLNSDGPNSNLVTVASALNIVGAAAKSMSYYIAPGRTVINNGNAIWGGGSITFSGQSSFQNNGSWNVTNDLTLGWTGTGSAAPLFQNNGTFTKSAGPGVLTLGSTTFTNSGTVAINSGGLTVGGPFVQTAGSSFLGTNFTASSSVRIQAGSFTGKGSIDGALYNNGTINPGASPGYMNGASFTNSAAGIYNVEIGGNTAAGTNYDQLRFSGPVTLDGTLNVSLYTNYALILSNRFTVLTTSARNGTFASVVPPPGVTLNTIYSSTNVVLEIAGLTNAPLQILTNPVSQTIWTPDPVTFSATVSGVTPITFQWQFNSNNIPGATNISYTIPAVALTNDGLYTLLITDGSGGTTNTSATLTVIPFANTIYWTNVLGGNWSVPANWLPNRIPNGTNNVVITTNGNYTVNVDVPAAVSNLTVGATGSTNGQTVHLVNGQSLAVNGNTRWETNTVLALNGLLQMNGGSNNVRGHIDWQFGTLSGAGRTVIATNASLTFVGSLNQKFIVTNVLENYGTFDYGNDSFGNAQGLRFSGGAQLTNYPSGVISIGTAAYDYSGSQTPRSYFVNHGTINANSTAVFFPTYISIDFINYGTLQDNGYCYLSRGANYGTFQYGNTLCEVSVFGDETTGEYFSFENGTVFVGTYPLLAVGGYAQWNSTSVHPGRLIVISGSGGASFANPEFRVLKNYNQTGQTIVEKGRWTQANPAVTANLNEMSDGIVNGFHYFTITNAGTLNVNTLSHNIRTLANSGSIIVRTNLSLTGSSYTYGGGSITIAANAGATFSGGIVEAQTVLNHGTNSVTGGMAFTGGTFYHNHAGARTWFGGGSFGTGPAGVLNEGLIDGFGGISALNATNRATVRADDSLNRNLALGNYVQESGLTEMKPGNVSGDLDIRGGLFTGKGTVTGNLRNAATVVPGQPFGLLSVTGNYTNAASGTYFLPINGAVAVTNFPQAQIGGTNVLAGTLYVNFTNGFNPAPGNLFTAMVFTARSGVFSSIVNDTYGLEAFYTATTVVLRAENLLPNVNLTVDGGPTQLVCQPFRFSASASDPDGIITNLVLKLNGQPVATSSGSPVTSSAESDSSMLASVVAQATDDRGGVRTVVQPVGIINFPYTNVLFLGGIRTNDFKLCLTGEPGRSYEVYASTNLTKTNWVNLGTMTESNGNWRYLDPLTITNRSQRYYRAKQLP